MRGASLLEALLGSLVLAGGLLAIGQGLLRERQASDAARERAQALRLAQHGLERLRAGQPLPAAPADGADADTAPVLEIRALADGGILAGARHAEVRWTDRQGRAQSLGLPGWLQDEEASGVLAWRLPPRGRDAARIEGRHAAVPREARTLGDGRSLHRPVPGADEAWLFDETDGRIVARCRVDAVAADAAADTATPSDCRAADALRVAGWVHRADAAGPGPAAPGTIPPPPTVAVSVLTEPDGSVEPCLGAAVRLVLARRGDSPRRLRSVALDAQPPAGEAWAELGERRWQFECAVPRRALPGEGTAPGRRGWSGRLQLVPQPPAGDGRSGASAPGPRWALCRYSADTDGHGGIDRPAESPAAYAGVTVALPAVAFLAVEAGQACPSRPAADAAGGRLPWSHANPATVPHDPG
ncbi:type IV pilus modification PilV family protein [Piscinibacter sakaiensis]|uniref:type IV pilus modification PilV family protein n=1 Tax=Piscinibacter sakaiensis TaxID=1547922 RepID=UPI0012FA42F6|nr:hypothetical protein [Piscinibacter sakaiensis]